MDMKVTDLNKIDVVAPTPRKACDSFGLSCSYWKQNAPHPSPQNSDWSGEDWDGIKAKTKGKIKPWLILKNLNPRQIEFR